MAEFYSASSGTIPPLPWQTFPLPFSYGGVRRVKYAASVFEKPASARGELNAATISRKEIGLEFDLERANLAA